MKNQNSTRMTTANKLFIAVLAVIIGVALIFSAASVQAQTTPAKTTDKVLKDSLVKGVKTPIYIGGRGGKYILVTSKSGNVYKKYIKK